MEVSIMVLVTASCEGTQRAGDSKGAGLNPASGDSGNDRVPDDYAPGPMYHTQRAPAATRPVPKSN